MNVTMNLAFSAATIFAMLSPIVSGVRADESSEGRPPLWARLCRVAEIDATPRPQWREVLRSLEQEFPYQVDWLLQDVSDAEATAWLKGDNDAFALNLVHKALAELTGHAGSFRQRLGKIENQPQPAADEAFQIYLEVCEQRRAERLVPLIQSEAQILFVEGWDQNEGRCSHAFPSDYTGMYKNRYRFRPGTKLRVLKMADCYGSESVLLEDAGGMIRDPDLSYDGKRVLFSWRKSEKEDDFHLYELDLSSGGIRHITSGLGFADVEGCYLPNGDIVFSSTRCVVAVDCMGHPGLNLYRCDKDGRFMRRLGFDQVGANHPSVLNDGRIIFTRWEYNDRNPVFLQPLIQMNPDGTLQTEFYGGNSSWPTSLHHARAIPGSDRVLAIASGHHTWQTGFLTLIDRSAGGESGMGLQLLAPRRGIPRQRVDVFPPSKSEPVYQYPWPLDEDECLAGVATFGRQATGPLGLPHFGIYYVHFDGARELLAKTPNANLSHPILLTPRPKPPIIPDQVDYKNRTAVCFVQDVYMGEGLAGVERGQAERLRVVALEYRADGIGIINNVKFGNVLTPISRNGSWDVKEVLGEAHIHEDGSVMVEVPALKPVYFQILDGEGRMILSMHSWTTLMPGERLSCVGCHESQDDVPSPKSGQSMALSRPPQELHPFYDVRGGFSFNRHIQPILDRHCVDCHKGQRWTKDRAQGSVGKTKEAFSLLARSSPPYDGARKWSDAYIGLVRPRDPQVPYSVEGKAKPLGDEPGDLVNPPDPSGGEAVVPPYRRSSATSRLMDLLEAGHEEVELSQEELDKIACWIDLGIPYCGDYQEANAWSDHERRQYEYYLNKRRNMQQAEQRNIEDLLRVSRKE